jgi:DNA mismatch endonuclease, patch repair protein
MADTLTKSQRSRCMSLIRSKDTGPELVVRRLVHALGYRFRLHVRSLPGTPDVVLSRHRKIIEVRGCFWHMHACGRRALPKTRPAYWRAKLLRNKARDSKTGRLLRRHGWKVLVVWECQTRDVVRLTTRITEFLSEREVAA